MTRSSGETRRVRRAGSRSGAWTSALWLCLAAACTSQVATELRPLSIDPASGQVGDEVPVRILGQGFIADRSVDFGRGSIEVDTGFAAWLGDTALVQVKLVDASTLEATVPATLAVGTYDLRVRAPSGAEGTLAAAFTVTPECLVDADCADGDVCDGREQCVAGRCTPGEPLECAAGPCVIVSCDPDVGCVSAPAGSSRETGEPCVPSLPPVVAVTVSPPAVVPGTVAWADASGTTDDLDALDALQFAWDWGDGGGFASGGATDSHVYDAPGTYTLWVEATDTSGSSGLASVDVVVAGPSTLIVVTRGDDSPLGTPPCSSGSLSLREAIACAQKTPGHDVILVQSGVTVALTSSLNIPADGSDVDVLGYGAAIDGRGLVSPTDCVTVQGGGLYFAGFDISGCPGLAVNVINGSGTRVAHCRMHDNGGGVAIGFGGNALGPANDVSTTSAGAHGVQLNQPALVVGNRLHGNGGAGIYVNHHGASSVSTIARNFIYANRLDGVLVNNTDGTEVWLDTIAGNTGSGIALVSSAGTDLRDVVLSGNGGLGIETDSSTFAWLDHDAFFQNGGGHCQTCDGSGDCAPCSGLAASLVDVDPLFVDATAGDYRLALGSPLVDAGVALDPGDPDLDPEVDVNGPEPGMFDGVAPDIGAWESP